CYEDKGLHGTIHSDHLRLLRDQGWHLASWRAVSRHNPRSRTLVGDRMLSPGDEYPFDHPPLASLGRPLHSPGIFTVGETDELDPGIHRRPARRPHRRRKPHVLRFPGRWGIGSSTALFGESGG